VDPFTEKGKAGASVDPVGSVRVYVVLEPKETRDGVKVPASEEETKGTRYLGPQRLEPSYVWMSSIPIEENYVRF
jgi:hypothetical protein